MTKISEALTYGITIRESANDGSDFTNPAADYRRLFLGEDGQLHVRDSAGTVTAIGAGSVATDAIWDAAGDLAVGSGANTAAALTKGSDNDVLTISASTHVPVWAAPAAGTDGYGPTGVYSADRIPASYNAASDEFNDSSLSGDWTWISAPAGTVSESAFPGFLHIDGGTDNANVVKYLRRAYVPGASSAFTVVAQVSASILLGNYTAGIGIAVLAANDAVVWSHILYTDGTTTGSKGHRFITTAAAVGIFGDSLNSGWFYVMFQRSAADVYKAYWSVNGLTWEYLNTSTVSTAVTQLAIAYASDTDAEGQGAVSWIRVFNSATKVVGAA